MSESFTRDTVGCFTEKEFGKRFTYKMNNEFCLHPDLKTGRNTQYPHLVVVGPNADQVRVALVKKTVAYVVVDETENGFVIEKWQIKENRTYFKNLFLALNA